MGEMKRLQPAKGTPDGGNYPRAKREGTNLWPAPSDDDYSGPQKKKGIFGDAYNRPKYQKPWGAEMESWWRRRKREVHLEGSWAEGLSLNWAQKMGRRTSPLLL